LRELGVETLDHSEKRVEIQEALKVAKGAAKNTGDAGRYGALRRNAATTTKDTPPPSTGSSAAPFASQITTPFQPAQMESAELEMGRPQDNLFGEVRPTKEDRLSSQDETLDSIWNDIGDCTRCPLYQGRTHVVNTEGNRKARLMFVGEAPGADEDAQARPFVGRAGQLLNKIIEAIGMKREEVLIGNVNRCRPPQNRAPTPLEASTCKPFLLREIALVQPDVIVVLGNTAMKNLLGTKEGITRLRGHFQDYHGIKVMPTFHPAYLLRDPSKKREAWDDIKKVRAYLDDISARDNKG
jgi:uracil-DNA glycosylase family 4